MTDESEPPMPISFVIAAATKAARQGFPIHTGENPSLLLKSESNACQHGSGVLDIDAESRTVRCSECGAMVDPFDALLTIARCERRLMREFVDNKKEREMRRGFYAEKRTEKAKRCRHKHTYPCGGGLRKCLVCDTTLSD